MITLLSLMQMQIQTVEIAKLGRVKLYLISVKDNGSGIHYNRYIPEVTSCCISRTGPPVMFFT